jgi:hypothetical protein
MIRPLVLALFLLMFASTAHAKDRPTAASASIYQGRRQAPGVEAEARTYKAPRPVRASPSGSESTLGTSDNGPSLAPLVGQVLCGHDPRIVGGLTCAVAPPPAPELVAQRPRRRAPSPDEVARRLADRTIALAPKPRLRRAPGRRGVTGLPSYFWLARPPQPITAQASAGGVAVTAEARPVQYVWNYGDGTDEATRRSGRRWTRWRPGSIAHVYEGKGRFRLTVEVIWEARWRTTFTGWRSLGYFSNSATRPYRVRAVIPVLVRAR